MALFRSMTPCFPVADISATSRWYTTHLGFQSDAFPENEPYVFAILSRDDVEIMLQLIDGYAKPYIYDRRSGGVWDAYIRTEGVRETLRISARGSHHRQTIKTATLRRLGV